ncbi:ABC transporter ATP-binding protein, partial [Planctomycetota bacterium]
VAFSHSAGDIDMALLQGAMAGAERIFELIDTPLEVVDPHDPAPLPNPLRGEIELRDVWFRYPESKRTRAPEGAQEETQAGTEALTAGGSPEAAGARRSPVERPFALRGVSVQVLPGERVAIVGHTGAGKSTVVNLLARFYDPTAGHVLLDGVPISTIRQRELRRQIGIVLQDVFIFTGTILENIRLWDPSVCEERALEAARVVGADSFIRELEDGYHTVLGERGATLSTGQKQLLSFARALAQDPKVLLLDEATASVDPDTEQRLQEAVHRTTEGRTSLVIAHRLATIKNADRILLLHRGELREQGSFRELVEQRGLFYTLYRMQNPDDDKRAAVG